MQRHHLGYDTIVQFLMGLKVYIGSTWIQKTKGIETSKHQLVDPKKIGFFGATNFQSAMSNSEQSTTKLKCPASGPLATTQSGWWSLWDSLPSTCPVFHDRQNHQFLVIQLANGWPSSSRVQRIVACSMVKMHGSSGAWEATWVAPKGNNRSLRVQENTLPKT